MRSGVLSAILGRVLSLGGVFGEESEGAFSLWLPPGVSLSEEETGAIKENEEEIAAWVREGCERLEESFFVPVAKKLEEVFAIGTKTPEEVFTGSVKKLEGKFTSAQTIASGGKIEEMHRAPLPVDPDAAEEYRAFSAEERSLYLFSLSSLLDGAAYAPGFDPLEHHEDPGERFAAAERCAAAAVLQARRLASPRPVPPHSRSHVLRTPITATASNVSRKSTAHHCHAKGCSVPVPPHLLMCAEHWRLVPPSLQRRVFSTYRKGQERDKSPSPQYLQAAREAIDFVFSQLNPKQ